MTFIDPGIDVSFEKSLNLSQEFFIYKGHTNVSLEKIYNNKVVGAE